MKNKFKLSAEEIKLFKEATSGTKPLLHDIVSHPPLRHHRIKSHIVTKCLLQEQLDASYYFSDEYKPVLEADGPIRYLRPDINPYELKKLRRNDYIPKLFLDLHGLSQRQAKQEIGALIATCYRDNIHSACIMHGHGKHILKQQIPLWLAQHPNITAFHQAPKAWGGSASLLILVETDETQRR
ncbi:Endonuclease MutS2 [Arsenophonus endosymbiont of Aleurodicus floccissimus]|uniref:endonuclease SmrB n=1 Tax=Arsenophonus endosymbiont of Aleurodicus floccissimus TaxID=2152761 RepID=UPI000E6B4604|nr:endonuclease SmrB [Arsenophonus endosymbiont of Aleurodicus floccissimus]SPP31492.1 Endonuclease MutS2 [Arsenophonus endosymbiont of Aleurodicus floccissimus]